MNGDTMSKSGTASQKRQLRDRKKREQSYNDDWASGVCSEEEEDEKPFNILEKLSSDLFTQCYVKEIDGSDLTVAYFQRFGFNVPLLFKDKTGLGLHVPSPSFSINDVRTCVGSRRIVDVMDTATQKNMEMTMKEFQRYYEDPSKSAVLNVISLEFSHTKLENYIQTPAIVRQLDWVDSIWPRHLKEAQIESTNNLDEMMYPKVQKYCLMSVAGCYTDFHIDFGGTSVWYHILRGTKVFWLIPPSEQNMKLYEQWVLSGKQQNIFFGDTVEKCCRIHLREGNTFFIPTGWIHAVYTSKDSLVFGGNFLHSYGIDKQIKVAHIEETTKVPNKFRYPFFADMLWYVLVRYIEVLMGKRHLSEGSYADQFDPSKHVHLTPNELHGIKSIVTYLHSLPPNKKCIPSLIMDPVGLIQDIRTLVEQHRHDLPEYAITGYPVVCNPSFKYKNDAYGMKQLVYPQHKIKHKPRPENNKERNSIKARIKSAGPRRRRTRCKKCAACQQNDCGECLFCQDMVKFGGPGRAKQTCTLRQCLQPMLPVTAACALCGLDGWGQPLVMPLHKGTKEAPSTLMECSVCYEIIHPDCVDKQCQDHKGIINEDLPNSWECPKCVRDGKNADYKPRHFRARQKWDTQRRKSEGVPEGSLGKRMRPDYASDSDGDEQKHKMENDDENSCSRWSDRLPNEEMCFGKRLSSEEYGSDDDSVVSDKSVT